MEDLSALEVDVVGMPLKNELVAKRQRTLDF